MIELSIQVKKLFILIIIIALVILSSLFIWEKFFDKSYLPPSTYQQQVPNIYSCTQDNDCISIRADNCGCTAGGKETAINKQYQKSWEDEHPSANCLAVMSGDPSCIGTLPKCVSNKCQLVKN